MGGIRLDTPTRPPILEEGTIYIHSPQIPTRCIRMAEEGYFVREITKESGKEVAHLTRLPNNFLMRFIYKAYT